MALNKFNKNIKFNLDHFWSFDQVTQAALIKLIHNPELLFHITYFDCASPPVMGEQSAMI